MKKKVESLYVDEQTFKEFKKKKKIILLQNNSEIGRFSEKSRVLIINEKNNRRILRKVNKVYDSKELIDSKKHKYIVPRNWKNDSDTKEKLGAIEFKGKLRIVTKFLLLLLIIVLLFIFYNFIKGLISQAVIADAMDYKREEEVIVFVDINPSIALKIKNETVIEAICLDQDCEDLLEKMEYDYDDDINNQKLTKVLIDFYDGAKEFGYDVSNGINVSSSSSAVEALVYDVKEVKYNHISVTEEENILNENNVQFVVSELSKEDYNNKLLEKLQNDPDYGNSYTCNINNGEVKCYMVDFMAEIMAEFGQQSLIGKLAELEAIYFKFKNLLEKFDFDYKIDTDQSIINITLGNGIVFDYADKYVYVVNDGNNGVAATIDITNCLSYKIYNLGNNNKVLEDKMYLLPFTKVELLTKTYDKKDVILVDRTHNQQVYYGIE